MDTYLWCMDPSRLMYVSTRFMSSIDWMMHLSSMNMVCVQWDTLMPCSIFALRDKIWRILDAIQSGPQCPNITCSQTRDIDRYNRSLMHECIDKVMFEISERGTCTESCTRATQIISTSQYQFRQIFWNAIVGILHTDIYSSSTT